MKQNEIPSQLTVNTTVPNMIIEPDKPMIPLDVKKELNDYKKIYIEKVFNAFRIFHCFESLGADYRIFGELPDGDKKLIFTSQVHFDCDCCELCGCDNCQISCCCCDYICCDRIIYQMDYKRNNRNFYTQGVNQIKGCYWCKCYFCYLLHCCPPSILFLRENTQPYNPHFDVGIKTGYTNGTPGCCPKCRDREASYTSQEGNKGYVIKLDCCTAFRLSISRCYCCNYRDIDISIEDQNGNQAGSIVVPDGCCSQRVEGKKCYLPGRNYEINLPPNATSFQKFQIIATVIHFDLENGLL